MVRAVKSGVGETVKEQFESDVALEYGLFHNRVTGSIDWYRMNTSDLLLTVPVPQPAVTASRLENVGSIRNHGVEFTLDAQAVSTANLSVVLGLVGGALRRYLEERDELLFVTGREARRHGAQLLLQVAQFVHHFAQAGARAGIAAGLNSAASGGVFHRVRQDIEENLACLLRVRDDTHLVGCFRRGIREVS